MGDNKLLSLPSSTDIETEAVLRKLSSAHRYLAELKGVAATIPNEAIIINTLSLQEAKDSSEIENMSRRMTRCLRQICFLI